MIARPRMAHTCRFVLRSTVAWHSNGVLLEIDAGESSDEPEELWRLADVLAIACGGHAGDAASMRRVLTVCKGYRIAAGAHPSYPDRAGFGRTTMAIAPAELQRSISQQCGTLATIGRELGMVIEFVKPHGALYHDASRDRVVANAVVHGLIASLAEAVLIGPPTGALADAARSARVPYLREGFADRGTRTDGSLIPRGEPGALISDPAAAAARARALAGQVESICVHADTPNALAVARAVRAEIPRG
jgi:UPF0271 protein